MDKVIWLVLLITFVVAEASTVSVVSLWFAAGALVSLVTALLGGPVWLQILLFVVVSAALLLALRPVVKKLFTPKLTPTNVDAVIGKEGIVIEPIDNVQSAGRVKLGANEWSARSSDGQPIEVGTRIRADRVEGVKVFVSALEVSVK